MNAGKTQAACWFYGKNSAGTTNTTNTPQSVAA
jgi:hypothetical protein